MDQDGIQTQYLLKRGFLSQSQAEALQQFKARSPNESLFQLALKSQWLSPEAFQDLQQILSSPSDRWPAVVQFVDRGEAPVQENSEARLSAELGEILKQKPWFAPHAEFLWEKLGTLGEGGMGVVQRVRDRRLNREAALKLMLNNEDPRALERFLREAKITARLDHPSIPPIYEAGKTASGQHYIVMKVIEGKTLSERIAAVHADGSPDEREIRKLLNALIKVGEALSYAHNQGVIHRDLKPENIMIGRFGEVLVMDWGIAKDLKNHDSKEAAFSECRFSEAELSSVGVTASGSMVGTPGYMAPEQIVGVCSPQSDVFSLGVILTELLTGKQAISGNSALERVVATASGSTLSPRQIDRSVPKELDALARAALEIDVEERLHTAEEIVTNLTAYLSGQALPIYNYSLGERFSRWSANNASRIVVLALLLLMLSSATIAFQLFQRSEQERQAALAREKQAQRAADDAKLRESRFREAIEKIQALEQLTRRGLPPQKLMKAIGQLFELGGRGYSMLMTAAHLCKLAGLETQERAFLEEASQDFSPGYEALYLLHEIEMRRSPGEFRPTAPILEIAKRAKKRGDKNEFSMLADAMSLYAQGKPRESLAAINDLESYSINFAAGYFYRGLQKATLGRKAAAMIDFDKAIQLDSNFATAYACRAVVRGMKDEDYEQSLSDYSNAIRCSPDYASAYHNRGVLYFRKGKFAEAERDYNHSIKADPQDPMTYNSRGALYMKTKKLELAFKDLSKAIELKPDYDNAYFNRAKIYMTRKNWEKALIDLDRALEINPNMQQALRFRQIVRARLGR